MTQATKTKTMYIAIEELSRFGLNSEMPNRDISNALRMKLDLPPRTGIQGRTSLKRQVLEKLNLDKTLSANDILKKIISGELKVN